MIFILPPPPTSRAASTRPLLRILARYDEVMKVMLPTRGEERQQTYSPFLPVSPKSGKVLLAKVVEARPARRHHYLCRGRRQFTKPVPVTGGHCKAAMEARHGHCAGRRWAWITRCTARIISPRRRSTARSARSPAAIRPNSICMKCSWTIRARRFPNPRAMASAWTTGWPMARRKAWRCSCFQKPRTAKKLYLRRHPQGGG